MALLKGLGCGAAVLGASRLGPGQRVAELLAGKLGTEVPPAVVVAAAVALVMLVGACCI